VASATFDFRGEGIVEYPYLQGPPPPGAPLPGPGGPNIIYTTSHGQMPGMSASYPPGYSRPRYSAGVYGYQPMSNAQEYYPSYSTANTSDGLFEQPYNYSSPTQTSYLPSHGSQASSAQFGQQESMRQWQHSPGAARAMHQSFDPDLTGTRYPHVSMAYSVAGDAAISSIDGAPLTTGMGALAISHQNPSMIDTRALPPPGRSNTVLIGSELTPLTTFADVAAASQLAQTNKPSDTWSASDRPPSGSGSSQASMGTSISATARTNASSGANAAPLSVSDSASSRKTSSSSPSPEASTYSYLSAASSSAHSQDVHDSGVSDFLTPVKTLVRSMDDATESHDHDDHSSVHGHAHQPYVDSTQDIMHSQVQAQARFQKENAIGNGSGPAGSDGNGNSYGYGKRAATSGAEARLLDGSSYVPFFDVPQQQQQIHFRQLGQGRADGLAQGAVEMEGRHGTPSAAQYTHRAS
jgi:hypothetical protein